MSTASGVRVIEFNARFGDPEALNVLPILETDFVAICQAIINGELTEDLVRFAPKATVCKYIVPEGYPDGKKQKGTAIQLPTACHGERSRTMTRAMSPFDYAQGDTALCLFFGDVTEAPDSSLRLGASRALGVVGIGNTIDEAEHIAQAFCEQVQGPVRFRRDIGTQKLLQKRVALMENLRTRRVCCAPHAA